MRIGVDFGWQHDLRTAHAAQRNRRRTTFPPQAQNSGQLVKSYTRAELKTHTPTCRSVCFTVGTMANAIAVSCPVALAFTSALVGRSTKNLSSHVITPSLLLLLLLSGCLSTVSSSSSSVTDAAAAAAAALAAACCCLLSCHTSRVVDFERFDFGSHAACNLRVCGGILFILFQFRSSLSSH